MTSGYLIISDTVFSLETMYTSTTEADLVGCNCIHLQMTIHLHTHTLKLENNHQRKKPTYFRVRDLTVAQRRETGESQMRKGRRKGSAIIFQLKYI